MKQHPASVDGLDLKRMTMDTLKRRVDTICAEVAKDEDDRHEWLDRQRRYYLRRHVRVDRGTDYPWPGAADIVIPTIDMEIDRVKATMARVIFTKPNVDFQARNATSADRIACYKTFFDWLLRTGIRDFKEQLLYLIDDVLSIGVGVAKISWDYRTEKRFHILRSQDLPSSFKRIFPDTFEGISQSIGAGVVPTLPSEREQLFGARRPEIERNIARDLNLDPEEEHDKKAIAQIFQLFTGKVKEVRYSTREVLANNPRLDAVDHQDFIVPACVHDIQSAPRLTHKIFLTESEFQSRARDAGWIKSAVRLVLDRKRAEDDTRASVRARRGYSETDDARRHREGLLNDASSDLIEVWEHYRWEDVDGDGEPERVCYLIHPGTKTVLANPTGLFYSHGLFPFVDVRMELNSPRYYSSRGIPEKIDDLDHEITKRHRAKLNKLEMLAPMFKRRLGANLSADNIRFIPGGIIDVFRMDDLEPVQIPDFTFPDEREENNLNTLIQRYIGALDTGLSDQKNLSEARTATEINAIQRSATEALSYRVEIFQTGIRRIYQMIWDLWNQWGSSDTFERVTGKPMDRLTSEQIKWDFSMDPIGSIQSTDPIQEEQRAFQRLDVLTRLLTQIPPEALGIKYEINLGEALSQWIHRSSTNDAKIILRERSPEEQQQLLQQRQALAERAERLKANAGVTPEELIEMSREASKRSPHGRQTRLVGA